MVLTITAQCSDFIKMLFSDDGHGLDGNGDHDDDDDDDDDDGER